MYVMCIAAREAAQTFRPLPSSRFSQEVRSVVTNFRLLAPLGTSTVQLLASIRHPRAFGFCMWIHAASFFQRLSRQEDEHSVVRMAVLKLGFFKLAVQSCCADPSCPAPSAIGYVHRRRAGLVGKLVRRKAANC